MTSLPANASPLRQRMIDDMRMRQLAPKTQDIYLHIVREFARFLGRSPDTATVEDLRHYQLHLVDHGTPAVSLNHAITGLKFFFTVTLDRPELMVRMQPVRVPRILPVLLSPDEVRRLIEAPGNLKHQTALSVAYGAGLRASEVVALKVTDVDSERMTLRIEQGKGRRDRYTISNQRLVALDERGVTFRWKDYRAKGRTRYKTMTLETGEFMRRFLLHVLPGGFHRIRHYGLLANTVRRANLAKVRDLLHVAPEISPSPDDAVIETRPAFICRHCGAPMIVIDILARSAPIRAPPMRRSQT